MAVEAGTRLGQYEILSSLGAGGMGEVYRARDTMLGREVAIKVLPQGFSEDPERMARFEREAKVLASLNHNNIATLHGYESKSGFQFLVMELVGGETLSDRIKRGAIPVDEVLPLFVQIAEGLEAAHEKGVIHRDLKPANIKVSEEGDVKILDFGLAKAMVGEADPSDPGISQSPTLTLAATRRGEILGTAAYMPPEQARGNPVDRRADIWAFGCCLFEALTGKRSFAGENVTDVLAAVVRGEPDWAPLAEKAPSSIRRLLAQCLEKDPKQRFQHIGDARIALSRDLHEEEARASPHSHWSGGAALALALAAGLTAATLTYVATRSPFSQDGAASVLVLRFSVQQPSVGESIGTFRKLGEVPTLSPDGRDLVFGAAGKLFLRRLSSLESKAIAGTEGGSNPFFAPDSQWVGFFAHGAMHRVSLEGGAPSRMAEVLGLPKGASWGAPDVIVSSGGGGDGLTTVTLPEGTQRALTVVRREEGEVSHGQPHVLPGSRSVLFTVATVEGPRIAVASMETGAHRRLFEGSAPRYVATGHLVYGHEGTLFAVPFVKDTSKPQGVPVPVLDGVLSIAWGNHDVVYYSVSDSGSLVYLPGGKLPQFGRGRLVWVNRNGESTSLTDEDDGSFIYPRLSPDGSRFAISKQSVDGRSLWIYDVARGGSMRLAFEGGQYVSSWSLDGRGLAYWSNYPEPGLYLAAVGATDSAQPLFIDPLWMFPGSWAPDGSGLAFTRVSPATKGDIWIAPGSSSEARPFVSSKFDERAPAFSPDGRFIAYVSDESGRNEVYVRDYPTGAELWPVSTGGGGEPLWSRDGRELFYRRGDELLVADVRLGDGLVLGTPRTVFKGQFRPTAVGPPNYEISLDGERFLMVEQLDELPTRMNVVVNWVEELKRLVPSD